MGRLLEVQAVDERGSGSAGLGRSRRSAQQEHLNCAAGLPCRSRCAEREGFRSGRLREREEKWWVL